jgi:hypothetical protein
LATWHGRHLDLIVSLFLFTRSASDVDTVRFTDRSSADGQRRRRLEAMEHQDRLAFEGDLVSRFRIGYPPTIQMRLRKTAGEAAARPGGPDTQPPDP